MDILTSTYHLDKLPQKIYTKIVGDLNYLDFLMDMENEEDSYPLLNDYLKSNRKIKSELIEEIVSNISTYTEKLLDTKIDVSDIYMQNILSKNRGTIDMLLNTRNLMLEQYRYSDYDNSYETDCVIYYIAAYINTLIYGGIFVFWNKDHPDSVLIQGISKYLESSMISILLSDLDKKLPRLNSLLQPAIEALARQLGANKIYVVPLERQGNILAKHYDFIRIDKVYFPCENILNAWVITKYGKHGDPMYVKHLEP